MKCWVQSIQMRRSRALIHPAFLAPDGMSGEVRQWRDLSFLVRLCPFFMCDSLGAYSRRRTILTSRHLVVPFHLIVFFLSFCFAVSSFYFSHACSSRCYSSLPDFRRALLFRAFRNGFDSINRFHFQFFAFLFSCSFLCCSTGKF